MLKGVRTLGLGVGALWMLASTPATAQRPGVETFSTDDGLPSPVIRDLAQDATGRLWILTRKGLAVYDGRTLRTVPAVAGLPYGVGLGRLAVDAEGRVLAVAARAGPRVFTRVREAWEALPPPDTEPAFEWVTALAALTVQGHRRVVVGTRGGGLWIWEDGSWTRPGAAAGPAPEEVHALEVAGGEVLVGTGAGLCRLAGALLDCAERELDRRLRDPILAIRADRAAPRTWLLAESWLGYLEERRLSVVADDLELSGFDPLARGVLALDRAGGVYFGAPGRAYFLDPATTDVQPLGLRETLAGEGASALLVDRESNVWIGGMRGLSQISGQRFLNLDYLNGLIESEVTAIAEIAPDRFLLGHNRGLTVLDGQDVTALPLEDLSERPDRAPRASSRVLDIAVDRRGQVWVAAQRLGLLRLGAGLRPEVVALPRPVFSVEVDGLDRLWAATTSELFVDEGSGFSRVELGVDLEELGASIRWLAGGPDGTLYLALAGGLLWLDGAGWHLARAAAGDHDGDNVYNVLARPSGEVWLGTAGGLYRLDGAALVPVREGPAIDRPVYFLLQAPDGRHWFGTDDGVFLWDGARLRQLTVRHGLAGRETNRGASLVDRRGRVWIGTGQGLSIYRRAYDHPPSSPPRVELAAFEAAGRRRSLNGSLALGHRENSVRFTIRTVALSRHERIVYRYQLEGFEESLQGPFESEPTEIRYTNLPPGRYRLRLAAGWAEGTWGDEIRSPEIRIAAPWWQKPWVYLLGVSALALALAGLHGLRTRAIRARNRELETLTRQLNKALADRQRLISELEEQNAELERFSYTVSHDLKTPLVTIKGFLGLLRRDAAHRDLERLEHDIRRIEGAADKMGRLLSELLELSRIGRVVHTSEAVALGELVAGALELVAGAIAERGVEIEVAPDLPVVVGDPVRLEEVFQNLIDNAVRFMGDEAHPRIEIGVQTRGGEEVLFVADNGLGVEPAYHEKIFGLFERLHPEIEGTGIGLAVVKRIVELHGGRIWIESEGRGRGSRFCFTVP